MASLWKRSWFLLFLGLVITSAFANIWLVLKVLDYKGRVLLAKEFRDETVAPQRGSGDGLVWIVGDSRAVGLPLIPSTGMQIVNRAEGGFTAKETLDRFRRDRVAGIKPSVVVVVVGINDVLSAGYNRHSRLLKSSMSGWPDRPGQDEIIDHCAKNIKMLVGEARASGAAVVLCRVFPPGSMGLRDRLFWDQSLFGGLAKLNKDLSDLRGPMVEFLDTTAFLEEDGRTKAKFSADTLHLNQAGKVVIAEALQKELLKLRAVPQ